MEDDLESATQFTSVLIISNVAWTYIVPTRGVVGSKVIKYERSYNPERAVVKPKFAQRVDAEPDITKRTG